MTLKTVPLWIPLQQDGTTPVQHPAELLRTLNRAITPRSGVVRPPSALTTTNALGDFAATVVPAAMQLTLAPGSVFVYGRENTLQSFGAYYAYGEASETISWPAASGANRMDSLILRITDPQYGSIGGNPLGAYWDAVAGSSAAARPDSDFLSGGSQYIPGAWLRMYDILVPASATQLTQANVAFKAGYANTLGYTPFQSTAQPTGLYVGEPGYEVDTGWRYTWNGTLWRGVPGDFRYQVSSTSNFGSGVGAEVVIQTLTGCVFRAGHCYRLDFNFGSSNTGAGQAQLAVRKTNVSGAILWGGTGATRTPPQGGAGVETQLGTWIRNSTGSNITSDIALTATSSGGTITVTASAAVPRSMVLRYAGTAAEYANAVPIT